MPPEITLTVTQKEKIIQTITKAVEGQQLAKSLEEFQVEANAALTKMIEELGEIGEASGDANTEEDDDDDDETDDDDADSSHSTSEDSKGHSTSKRKKHN